MPKKLIFLKTISKNIMGCGSMTHKNIIYNEDNKLMGEFNGCRTQTVDIQVNVDLYLISFFLLNFTY